MRGRPGRALFAVVVVVLAVLTAAPALRGVHAPAQVLQDLRYGDDSPRQTLDLSLPDRRGDPVPVVVVVHGGGWFAGDKHDVLDTVRHLNAAGYATVAPNYRLSGEARFPAAVDDVAATVAWVREQAPEFGLDPDRVALFGFSAGGHLAATAALTGPAVQAVVTWYAPFDFSAMDAQAAVSACEGRPDVHGDADSPESRWLGAPVATRPELAAAAAPARHLAAARERDGALPAFHLVHGAADCTVPAAQSEAFAASLRAAGAPVSLTVLPGAGHSSPEISAGQTGPSIAALDRALGGAP